MFRKKKNKQQKANKNDMLAEAFASVAEDDQGLMDDVKEELDSGEKLSGKKLEELRDILKGVTDEALKAPLLEEINKRRKDLYRTTGFYDKATSSTAAIDKLMVPENASKVIRQNLESSVAAKVNQFENPSSSRESRMQIPEREKIEKGSVLMRVRAIQGEPSPNQSAIKEEKKKDKKGKEKVGKKGKKKERTKEDSRKLKF